MFVKDPKIIGAYPYSGVHTEPLLLLVFPELIGHTFWVLPGIEPVTFCIGDLSRVTDAASHVSIYLSSILLTLGIMDHIHNNSFSS